VQSACGVWIDTFPTSITDDTTLCLWPHCTHTRRPSHVQVEESIWAITMRQAACASQGLIKRCWSQQVSLGTETSVRPVCFVATFRPEIMTLSTHTFCCHVQLGRALAHVKDCKEGAGILGLPGLARRTPLRPPGLARSPRPPLKNNSLKKCPVYPD